MQNFTTTQWLRYFSKFFVNQSSKAFKKISKKKRTACLVIMISMLCITSLTKCMTSSLLKTFFKVKPHLTVNTLEDIVDNPDLFVAGRHGLKELIRFKPQIFEKLENRIKKYEKSLDINSINMVNLGSPRLIRDVQEGRAVILTDTFVAKVLKLMHPSFDLMESNYKYNQNFFYSYVTKNHTKSHEIYKMFV